MKKCLDPQCGRVDGEIGQCGSPVTCPHREGSPTPPADVDTQGRDVLLTNTDDGTTRVVSVEHLLNPRKPVTVNGFAGVEPSKIRAVVPSNKQAPAKGTTPAKGAGGNNGKAQG